LLALFLLLGFIMGFHFHSLKRKAVLLGKSFLPFQRRGDENLFDCMAAGGRLKDATGRSLRRSRFRSSLDPPAAAGIFASRFFIAEICRCAI